MVEVGLEDSAVVGLEMLLLVVVVMVVEVVVVVAVVVLECCRCDDYSVDYS